MYASAFFLNGLNFNTLENIEHNTKQVSWEDKNSHFSQLFMK